jgi:DNA-binding response OmpR family regulator
LTEQLTDPIVRGAASERRRAVAHGKSGLSLGIGLFKGGIVRSCGIQPEQAMRILVVEDNPKLSGQIANGLRANGHAVDEAARGTDAKALAAHTAFDAIILDLMLPDCDGLEVCRDLRGLGITTPILMLTAIDGLHATVDALNAGADDYLTKPFDFEELMARIRALLRRGRPTEGTLLCTGDIELNLLERRVSRRGQTVPLGFREMSLLEFLMRNPDRVVSRSDIHEHVWGGDSPPESNVIDVQISTLRRKLGDQAENPLLRTITGVGYMWSAGPPAGART